MSRLQERLYHNGVDSTRVGAVFNAHHYPTKINPEAALAWILAHTEPGDTVYDGFGGSGIVGIAATMAGTLSDADQARFRTNLGKVQFGYRDCVLYDISQLGVFISATLLNPPPPAEFGVAADDLLRGLEHDFGWMYEAVSPDGPTGTIRHSVWTDYVVCVACGAISSFWESAVRWDPLSIAERTVCRNGHDFRLGTAPRETRQVWDDLLSRQVAARRRTPAFVYGETAGRTWKRPALEGDLDVLARIAETQIPGSVPIVRMMETDDPKWGAMHRSGYHEGITHLHHFYTRRNLIAVAAAWERIETYPGHLRDGLRLLVSSYNVSHSTLMTRVVVKAGMKDFVVTSGQPAALYISSLPVEKNVFRGLRRKIRTLRDAFGVTHGRANDVQVQCASSLAVDLPAESVDYIFTDPPFGENIQYAEVNFISEAWLGRTTDAGDEVIVSSHQGKTVAKYTELLTGALSENYRVLKPGRLMTLAFHSASAEIWRAVQAAWTEAGFELVATSVLDKAQTSFKQTTAPGSVSKDPLIVLRKPTRSKRRPRVNPTGIDTWSVVAARLAELPDEGVRAAHRSREHLYSYLVRYHLERGTRLDLDADTFYRELRARFADLGSPSVKPRS